MPTYQSISRILGPTDTIRFNFFESRFFNIGEISEILTTSANIEIFKIGRDLYNYNWFVFFIKTWPDNGLALADEGPQKFIYSLRKIIETSNQLRRTIVEKNPAKQLPSSNIVGVDRWRPSSSTTGKLLHQSENTNFTFFPKIFSLSSFSFLLYLLLLLAQLADVASIISVVVVVVNFVICLCRCCNWRSRSCCNWASSSCLLLPLFLLLCYMFFLLLFIVI